MLYEFHRSETKKKAGSVHATYLVAGSRYETETTNGSVIKDGDDVVMQSSQPFPSSPAEAMTDVEDDTPILSITLVREEDLEEARKSYESISSIHLYSLGPTKIKNLQTLSDANREVVEKYSGQNGSQYGTITNKNVRKRVVGGPRLAPTGAPAPAAKAKPAAAKKEEAKPVPAKKAEEPSATGPAKEPALKGKTSSKNFFSQPSNAAKKDSKTPSVDIAASSNASKPAALKRGNSGSIFASFAKAKPKAASESSAASSAAQSPASIPEDFPMKDVSDDEEDTYVAPPPKPRAKKEAAKKEVTEDCKSRKEREAALLRMMDEASDEEPSKSTTPAITIPDEDNEPEEVQPPKKDKPEPKEYVEIFGGRRRGKRRVVKKKTMRDEEGYLGKFKASCSVLCALCSPFQLTHYLVTKEEPAWESFSEDEPVAKAKPAPSQASQKKKPAAGKAGQGSIMSFFAKKI